MAPAVEIVNEAGRSPYVLICEHASNFIPAGYHGLGLGGQDLDRHIAWDIGAAAMARALSGLLDAPLFLAGYSRLLIDCNRPLESPTSIAVKSENSEIPGNQNLAEDERRYRQQTFYWPFQHAVARHLDARQAEGRPAIVVGAHSFTPVFHSQPRPWHAGVLFRRSHRLGEALVAALGEPGLVVAANEPYSIDDESDYTVPVHGEARGLEAMLIEIRQDLIGTTSGAVAWAGRLARALEALSQRDKRA
jgi:predicted N-formylglutamate amidohydrolase